MFIHFNIIALDVQYNSITNEGLKDLDYLIKLNKTLTIFDLRNNYIGIY